MKRRVLLGGAEAKSLYVEVSVGIAGCLRLRDGGAGGSVGAAGRRARQEARCRWRWLPEAKSWPHRLHHLRAPGVMLVGSVLAVLLVAAGCVPALGDGMVSAGAGGGGRICIWKRSGEERECSGQRVAESEENW